MIKKETPWKEFMWKLFTIKVRILHRFLLIKEDLRYFVHCRKGFHSYDQTLVKLTKNKKWSRTSNYFKCRICGDILFPTPKDRRSYETINRQEIKSMRKSFKKSK